VPHLVADLDVATGRAGEDTGGVHAWLEREIITPGRLPLALALVAFVATFIVTRAITRMIRSGRGPIKNVTSGDLHIHHVVPGVVSLLVGGVLLLAASRYGPWRELGAVLFGIGAALVLDEFALILHLDDVYWKREGVLSVDAITIGLAVMAAALLVAAPDNPPSDTPTDHFTRILGPVSFIVLWLIPTAITVLKGRLLLAALSIVQPVFGWWGMIRLARPGSPWASIAYGGNPGKMQRAQLRADRADARVAPLKRWWATHIFGMKTDDAAPTAALEAPTKATDPSEPNRPDSSAAATGGQQPQPDRSN